MLDVTKLKYLKMLGYLLLIVLAVIIGVGIGQSMSGSQTNTKSTKTTQSDTKINITQNQVKQFLLNYYTKKDLGENRKRYKEYMTDALYQQIVATEEEPQNQTYKGFVVDFEFKSAEIYINESSHQVIAQVNYVNTQLDEKKNYDTAQKDVMNHTTLRLTYVNEDGKMKVNKMESLILTDQTGDYGILDSSSSSEETSDNQSTTETKDASTESSAS
ncbi:TPA: hypothetical protein VBN11_002006 [Streptococcus agalactiae]|nr:hypothetical protein [Streptococcus agalactiae]